jgi:hypothetical protein
MCHHRSLLVSIQAFNGGLGPSRLPIQTHTNRWFIQSIFKATELFRRPLAFSSPVEGVCSAPGSGMTEEVRRRYPALRRMAETGEASEEGPSPTPTLLKGEKS